MLSYQHIYHAGGLADLHKHAVLCAALDDLRARWPVLTYMETHAGRGLYDLTAAEAAKTGEAAQGWLSPGRAESAPPLLAGIVRGLNGGALAPLYPGSPMIAAGLLRARDKIHLMELHPREHAALEQTFRDDGRVTIYKRDGYEGVFALAPPAAPCHRGLVLIDPSYEIKDEYRQAAAFIDRLRRRWPDACILLWYPLLPAARHEPMKRALCENHPGASAHEAVWELPGEGRGGMYGSGMMIFNAPFFLPGAAPV